MLHSLYIFRLFCPLFLLCALIPCTSFAQKILQLEHVRRVRTQKMYVGYPLRYKLNDPGAYWERRTITDMSPSGQHIVLNVIPVPVADIAAIKLPKSRISYVLGSAFTTFGGTLLLATGYAAARGDQPNAKVLVPLACVSLGSGLWMVQLKTHHLGKKRRLRVIQIGY